MLIQSKLTKFYFVKLEVNFLFIFEKIVRLGRMRSTWFGIWQEMKVIYQMPVFSQRKPRKIKYLKKILVSQKKIKFCLNF